MSAMHCDVLIAGGGLAGLTLALQLRAACPELDIVVLERSTQEPPLAAHKVGESTVEIGAHYLSENLGLRSLLDQTQLRKFGLRFFFGTEGDDLARADELGASDFFANATFQLDRGRFERDLFVRAVESGVDARRGCAVFSLDGLDSKGVKRVRFRDESGEHEAQCRWFVDTSGRASVLQRARSLQRPANHATCAAWFRVDGVIDIDRWSSDEAWKSRNSGMGRLLSTNHLMGPGYWVWIIPLPEGRTSIGLVSDPEILPLDQFNTPEKFAAWARLHHPMLADALEEFSGPAMDFRYLPSLARDCKQFWSDDGWALSGDAGVFSDPFYSPGTDYIAIANSYITDFVTRGVDGKPGQPDVRFFHSVYRSFFASTISLYRQQYAGFGDSRLMALKSTWDYSYYWSVLAWMYMRGLLHDAEFLKQSQSELQDALALNNHMQALFRKRAESRKRIEPRGRFVDQQAIPILCELSAALRSSDTAPAVEIRENCIRLGALAVELEQILGSGDREGGSRQERAHSQLLGDLAGRLA